MAKAGTVKENLIRADYSCFYVLILFMIVALMRTELLKNRKIWAILNRTFDSKAYGGVVEVN